MSKTKKNLHMCAKYVYFQEWVKRNNMIKYSLSVAKTTFIHSNRHHTILDIYSLV